MSGVASRGFPDTTDGIEDDAKVDGMDASEHEDDVDDDEYDASDCGDDADDADASYDDAIAELEEEDDEHAIQVLLLHPRAFRKPQEWLK
jgi:hypothetical protein